MKNKIEHPKVFISYAWGNKDYEAQVLSFATNLQNDGIEVIIDKWDLSKGNDTFAFMEKCVNDETITNVLILLDPLYATKANAHSGGVGTETQIISAKVYKEVDQDKFLPIVMLRDENNSICKPTFLESRLHFDLSIPETYDDEYKRIVKTLYGVEIYPKPPLGEKPNWVDEPLNIVSKKPIQFDRLKNESNESVKNNLFLSYLGNIKNKIAEFSEKQIPSQPSFDSLLKLYAETEDIRNEFLQLIQSSLYVTKSYKAIADFFEELRNILFQKDPYLEEVLITRIHEMFIYTIAWYLKSKDYNSIGHLLGKTYFNRRISENYGATDYTFFYSGSYHNNLDQAIKNKDGKEYVSGIGSYWIQTLATDFCSKKQFILADELCFNYSVYGANNVGGSVWFPITYIFENPYDNEFRSFARRLISKEFVEEVIPIFEYKDVNAFVKRLKEIELELRDYTMYRYGGVFDSAYLLGNFIKAEKVATLQ